MGHMSLLLMRKTEKSHCFSHQENKVYFSIRCIWAGLIAYFCWYNIQEAKSFLSLGLKRQFVSVPPFQHSISYQ